MYLLRFDAKARPGALKCPTDDMTKIEDWSWLLVQNLIENKKENYFIYFSHEFQLLFKKVLSLLKVKT